MAHDIAVPVGDYFFNYRVAAIIQREGSVLINRLVGQEFWFLPGGRVQAGEATSVAIAREIRKELLVACTVVRSVFLHETFFLHGEKQFHEICVYYEVALASEDAAALSSFSTANGGIELEWVKVDRLADVNLQPPLLRSRLEQLPPTLEHITDRHNL